MRSETRGDFEEYRSLSIDGAPPHSPPPQRLHGGPRNHPLHTGGMPVTTARRQDATLVECLGDLPCAGAPADLDVCDHTKDICSATLCIRFDRFYRLRVPKAA